MTEPTIDLQAGHRWFAIECNNRAWDLLDVADRTAAQEREMLHAAHAACHHWYQVGSPVNFQRAEVLVANVHAAAGDGASALRHAELGLQLAQDHSDEVADFDWAFAHEALARAHAAAGHADEARHHKQLAREAGEQIAGAEDRKIFEAGFAAGNWHGIE